MEKNEYEIQHFNFSAAQVSLERKYFLKKIVADALIYMVKELSASPDTQDVLMEKKQEVSQLIMKSVEPGLKEAAELDRKNFSIPKHILLAPDFDQTKQYTEVDECQADQELAALKQQFLENSVMLAALKMENEQYSCIEPHVQDELKMHSEILSLFETDDWSKWAVLIDETKDIVALP